MSLSRELSRTWEGRVVDGKFPLRRWLGGSEHSAVFLTERAGAKSETAAIKLIPAGNLGQESPSDTAQLSCWTDAAKLSHPPLIRLFECGVCQIDNARLLYVVMECAEENLAEILPVRPLTADEASAMLEPTAQALAYLHQSGFAHGRIRPSNIMAVHDVLKISADGLCKIGKHDAPRIPSPYDAPELATAGPSPSTDIWSLGATLVAVLTQHEPELKNMVREPVTIPETIPQSLREIARRCLQIDPQQRCTAREIVSQLRPQAVQPHAIQAQAIRPQTVRSQSPAAAKVAEVDALPAHQKRRVAAVIVVAALILAVWAGAKFLAHKPAIPAAENEPAKAADIPAEQSPAPFSQNKKPVQTGVVPGSVLQQVMPDVSPGAKKTIEGRLKVAVEVSVDTSGNVTEAKFVSQGPSPYFANRALAAARRWKFNPAQIDGQAAASKWILRFQFRKTSTEVFPAEKNP